MNFKSYSQIGQDKWVFDLIGEKGTFLDIGASHPTELSNTKGLEEIGWSGICVEVEHSMCDLLRAQRKAMIIEEDATKIDWRKYFSPHINQHEIDYLSLDIDAATLDALQNLPLQWMKFKVITVEHDAYRMPPEFRDGIREILTRNYYYLVRPDVCCTPGMPMEDWWTTPELADKTRNLP